jgi:hypothetical protein
MRWLAPLGSAVGVVLASVGCSPKAAVASPCETLAACCLGTTPSVDQPCSAVVENGVEAACASLLGSLEGSAACALGFVATPTGSSGAPAPLPSPDPSPSSCSAGTYAEALTYLCPGTTYLLCEAGVYEEYVCSPPGAPWVAGEVTDAAGGTLDGGPRD